MVIGAIGVFCSGCSRDDASVRETCRQTVILLSTLPNGQEIASRMDVDGDKSDDDIVSLLTEMMFAHGRKLPDGRFRSDGIVFEIALILRPPPVEIVEESGVGPVAKRVSFTFESPYYGLVQLEDGRYFYAKPDDSVWPGPERKRHEGYFGTLEEAGEPLARGILREIRETMSAEWPPPAPVLAEPDKVNSS